MPGTHPAAHTSPLLEYSGTLVQSAQVRVRVCSGVGEPTRIVPVLCLEVELIDPEGQIVGNTLHAEQPFPVGQHYQAKCAASRLKKGTRVTVKAPATGLHLVAHNAAHVHVIKPKDC